MTPDSRRRPPPWGLLGAILTQPTVAFVALGALLVGLGQAGDGDPKERVEISAAQVQRCLARGDSIESLVDEEILVREAIAVGIGRRDPEVREILIGRMRELLETPISQPSPGELREYFEEHREEYVHPESVSFVHVYFRRERFARLGGGDEILQALRGGGDRTKLGDPFWLGATIHRWTRGKLARNFGPEFAERVLQLPTGIWEGPVESAVGVHFVHVTRVEPRRIPEYDDIRAKVASDWRRSKRREAERREIDHFRRRHSVPIEPETVRLLEIQRSERIGRALSPAERREVREEHIDEEVLLREAMRRGLDRTDPEARRRLLSLIRYVLDEPVIEPTRRELEEYYRSHLDRYRSGKAVTFVHVYFDLDSAEALDRARDAFDELLEGADPGAYGDTFWAGRAIDRLEEAQLRAVFGDRFADELERVEVGVWTGPFESSSGVHLVKVLARHAPALPSLDAIEERVRQDLLAERRSEIRERKIAEIRERYEIVLPEVRGP